MNNSGEEIFPKRDLKAKKSFGLTFIEIIIAIAVIGILAAVVVPIYRGHLLYSNTNTCATYMLASRFNATRVIVENGGVTGISEEALGLANDNGECSGGITVTEEDGGLTIQGSTGTLSDSGQPFNRFTMTRAASDGAWVCSTSDAEGNVLSTGSCTEFGH